MLGRIDPVMAARQHRDSAARKARPMRRLIDAACEPRDDDEAGFSEIMGQGPNARMAVVSTEPLTRDEMWIKAAPGTLWVFGHGELLASFEG